MVSSEVTILSSKPNAIIGVYSETDQYELFCLICSHCWQSADGLSVHIQWVECFISTQWFNALWCATSCASHTSRGELLENTWGEDRWGLVPGEKDSLHCRNCADWAILIIRPCLFSELSEVQEPCVTVCQGGRRGPLRRIELMSSVLFTKSSASSLNQQRWQEMIRNENVFFSKRHSKALMCKIRSSYKCQWWHMHGGWHIGTQAFFNI